MTSGSARPRHSAQRLQSGVCFTRLQSFDNLQASEFAATQVVPTASIQCGCRGGRGVYIRAERGSLPNRASDMLAVRIGQLTAEVFHLLDLQPCWLLRSRTTPTSRQRPVSDTWSWPSFRSSLISAPRG